jgi:hypothetical protein
MQRQTKIGARSALMAFLTATLVIIPLRGDTLVLRDGRTIRGRLVRATSRSITFENAEGRLRDYFVEDLEALQFGDGPYRSGDNPGGYDRRGPDFRDNRGNGYDQPSANQGDGNYDPSRLEHVTIPAGTEISV